MPTRIPVEAPQIRPPDAEIEWRHRVEGKAGVGAGNHALVVPLPARVKIPLDERSDQAVVSLEPDRQADAFRLQLAHEPTFESVKVRVKCAVFEHRPRIVFLIASRRRHRARGIRHLVFSQGPGQCRERSGPRAAIAIHEKVHVAVRSPIRNSVVNEYVPSIAVVRQLDRYHVDAFVRLAVSPHDVFGIVGTPVSHHEDAELLAGIGGVYAVETRDDPGGFIVGEDHYRPRRFRGSLAHALRLRCSSHCGTSVG